MPVSCQTQYVQPLQNRRLYPPIPYLLRLPVPSLPRTTLSRSLYLHPCDPSLPLAHVHTYSCGGPPAQGHPTAHALWPKPIDRDSRAMSRYRARPCRRGSAVASSSARASWFRSPAHTQQLLQAIRVSVASLACVKRPQDAEFGEATANQVVYRPLHVLREPKRFERCVREHALHNKHHTTMHPPRRHAVIAAPTRARRSARILPKPCPSGPDGEARTLTTIDLAAPGMTFGPSAAAAQLRRLVACHSRHAAKRNR